MQQRNGIGTSHSVASGHKFKAAATAPGAGHTLGNAEIWIILISGQPKLHAMQASGH